MWCDPVVSLQGKLAILLTTMLAAAAWLPLAAAQAPTEDPEEETSTVTFYGHIFGSGRQYVPDGRSVMPMNTQFPFGEADLSQGRIAHSCGSEPADASCEDDQSNEAWLYTTAGFVQIKNYEEFSYEELHNERGLTKDTRLDTTQDITAEFYMSADYHGWLLLLCTPGAPHDVPWPLPCWNWDPGYLHQWQVEATVYTGVLGEYGGEANTPPNIAEAFEQGKLTVLAQGVSDVIDVKSLEPLGNPTVWKFDINLGKPQRTEIKKEESYLVRYQWWGVKPDGSRRIVAEVDTWNVNSGEYYPPLLKLPVKGAFNVEMVLPQFVYEKLVILGIMNTPWGSYDVDHDSIQLTIRDGSGREHVPVRIERLADFSVAHGGHYKPVNVTYVWDYKADGLPPGDYTATIEAANFQGSASARCTAEFTVLQGGAPGAIKVGQCGVRTITDDQLKDVKEGSKDDAAGEGGGASGGLPGVPVRLAGAEVVPVSASPLAGLAALAALAVGLVLRRWRP